MKIIKLTQDQETMVDDEDYAFLLQFSWYAQKQKSGQYTVRTRISVYGECICKVYCKKFTQFDSISMHQLLSNTPDNLVVDHIDGNSLNNQKSNLRVCTQQQNSWNARKRKISKSGKYKGIREDKRELRTTYYVSIQGKYIDYFYNEEKAARCYDREAIKRFGEFACTNFPKEDYAVHSIHS